MGLTVHPQTLRNVLYSASIHGRCLWKKLFISEANRIKRFPLAKESVHKPSSSWQTATYIFWWIKIQPIRIWWTSYVWRKINCELQTKNLLPTVKFGGGNVRVWGWMAASGAWNLVFIDRHMTGKMYVDILRANLKTSARKLGLKNCFHFQQDNNTKHTMLCTHKFLLYNAPRRLLTSPQSPDMNIIENLLSLLEVKFIKYI